MSQCKIQRTSNGLLLPVKLQPSASKSEICGCHGAWLKVKVCSPPVEGRANRECIKLFADLLDTARGNVSVASGEKSRTKQILISGDAQHDLMKALKNLGISARFD